MNTVEWRERERYKNTTCSKYTQLQLHASENEKTIQTKKFIRKILRVAYLFFPSISLGSHTIW